ncbi:phosphoenolpyruvate--protein phosphotransferase [candidate division WOR-3 bacterium]|uniref:Phosphoenolpyruvate-protein phosphotransferase n=1 Tax=candidate division WOR-3 bacterium TaxID=2052148 RepID=A0A9D5K8H7_UNCW3|nr:phosphoenolpyruvate--protein phosphotransferase [candidate division WOR-3 bacterium]MBD3364282.1 phosphoenolpyruvate--protein phosphotransferase [candidate division WOR-3 bacterium]
MKIIRGIAVSGGIGMGTAFLFTSNPPELKKVKIPESNVETEKERLSKVIASTRKELTDLQVKISKFLGNEFGDFLEVQIQTLSDPALLSICHRNIGDSYSAEYSFSKAISEIAKPLLDSKVGLFKERLADIEDVTNRVLRNLLSLPSVSIIDVPKDSIVLAHTIPPSEIVLLDSRKVNGLATEIGGRTSHIAIIAKALEIPAVLGVEHLLDNMKNDEPVVVDAQRGQVILAPTSRRIQMYSQEIKAYKERRKSLITKKPPQTVITRDEHKIDVSANIELTSEIYALERYGANGVGLFRTEYLFLTKRRFPTEEEQYRIYSEAAMQLKPHPLIIRTLDIGGDKVFPGYEEANPFLGWRAVRFLFDNEEIFLDQLRAIVRASAHGSVKIMFPMISSLSEIRFARRLLDSAKEQLRDRGQRFDPEMEVGIMVEIPSAALLADRLTEHVDFFSIGTNDLTQYTLAVDRGNEKISALFSHYHPAVLQLIRRVIGAGHKAHIWVGVCGEMAAEPLGIPLLVGMGVDELSMTPCAVPFACKIIRGVRVDELRKIVSKVMEYSTATDVVRYLRRKLSRTYPDLAKLFLERKNVCYL